MKSMLSVLIPFAIHKPTGRNVGIDEVPSGLKCECDCIECGMRLKARKNYKDNRADHFAHHDKAKTKCPVSYWVSVRSMAKQILEEAKYLQIPSLYPKLFNTSTITIYSGNRSFSPKYQFTLDFHLSCSLGDVYIFFVTEEDDRKEMFHQLPEFFSDTIVIAINLCSIKYNHNKAKEYLSDLILHCIDNKKILATSTKLLFSKPLLTQTNTSYSKKLPYLALEDYKEFICTTLGYENFDLFDSEDLTVCSKMISFFKDKSGVSEGHNLKKYYAGIARHLLCVAQIRLDYFVYTVDENNIIQIIKKLGSQAIVNSYIKHYDEGFSYESNSPKTNPQKLDKMLRLWNIFKKKEKRQYCHIYTEIDMQWGIKIVSYQSDYFGIAPDRNEWIVYQVFNGEIEILSQQSSENQAKEFIIKKVDQEKTLF